MIAVLAVILGCTGTTSPESGNAPPDSEIVEPAEPSGTLTAPDGEPITFKWQCVDPEEQSGMPGGLVAMRIQLDSADPIEFTCPPDSGSWWFSSSEEAASAHHISSVNLPTGGNQAHTFRVWAQDIEGLWEPATDGAAYVFSYNNPPSSEILSPSEEATTSSSFAVTWRGSDVDGQVAAYQYALDPGTAVWLSTGDTWATCSGVAPGEHEFRLRAKDDSGCWEESYSTVTFQVE